MDRLKFRENSEAEVIKDFRIPLPTRRPLNDNEIEWLEKALKREGNFAAAYKWKITADGRVNVEDEQPGELRNLGYGECVSPGGFFTAMKAFAENLLLERDLRLPEFATASDDISDQEVAEAIARLKIQKPNWLKSVLSSGAIPQYEADVSNIRRILSARKCDENSKRQLALLSEALSGYSKELRDAIESAADAQTCADQSEEEERELSSLHIPISLIQTSCAKMNLNGFNCDIRMQSTNNTVPVIKVTLDSESTLSISVNPSEGAYLKHQLEGLYCSFDPAKGLDITVGNEGAASIRASGKQIRNMCQ